MPSKTLRWKRMEVARVCTACACPFSPLNTALFGCRKPKKDVPMATNNLDSRFVTNLCSERRNETINMEPSRLPWTHGTRGQMTQYPSPFPLNHCLLTDPTDTALKRHINTRGKWVAQHVRKTKHESLTFRRESKLLQSFLQTGPSSYRFHFYLHETTEMLPPYTACLRRT